MDFDLILENPPYGGTLHLEILQNVINHINDNGLVVNLSPIGLLQKYYTLGNTRILTFNIFENVVHVIKVPIRYAMRFFKLDSLGQDLGIWVIKKGRKTNILELSRSLVDNVGIVDKMKNKMAQFKSLKDRQVSFKDIDTSFPLKFVYGLSLANHGGYGTSCYAPTSINYETAIKPIPGNHTVYVCYNSEEKRRNAHTLFTTTLMRFFYKEAGMNDTPYNVVGDFEGLLDRRWTDNTLCDFFGITDGEWDLVQETMRPYL